MYRVSLAVFRWILISITMAAVWLLSAVVQPSLVSAAAQQAPNRSITTCYLLFSSPSDLGFSFATNRARIDAHSKITELFDRDLSVKSVVSYDWYLISSIEERANRTIELVTESRCDTVFSTSLVHWRGVDMNSIATMFPGTLFVDYSRTKTFSKTNPANLIGMHTRLELQYFVSGYVSGTVSKTCAGFVFPFLPGNVVAFYQGYKKGLQRQKELSGDNNSSSTATLYATQSYSYNTPEKEKIAAELLLRKGCDVISYIADTREIPLLVEQTTKERRRRRVEVDDIGGGDVDDLFTTGPVDVFSIGYHSNAAELVGDSVLTSIMVDMYPVFLNVTEQFIQRILLNASHSATEWGERVLPHGVFNGILLDLSSGVLKLGELSPKAPREAHVAMNEALAQVQERNSGICDPILYAEENEVSDASSSDGTSGERAAAECLGALEAATIRALDIRVHSMASVDVPSSCVDLGTYPHYNLSDFTMKCVRCPEGMTTSYAGQRTCIPKSAGQFAAGDTTDNRTSIIVAVVLAVVAASLCIAIVTHFSRVIASSRHSKIVFPPSSEFVALAVIGIEDSSPTEVQVPHNPHSPRKKPPWRTTVSEMCSALDQLDELCKETCLEFGVYVAWEFADLRMLVCESPVLMLQMITELKSKLARGALQQSLTLRAAIHVGTPKRTYIPAEASGRSGMWSPKTNNNSRTVDEASGRPVYSGDDVAAVQILYAEGIAKSDQSVLMTIESFSSCESFFRSSRPAVDSEGCVGAASSLLVRYASVSLLGLQHVDDSSLVPRAAVSTVSLRQSNGAGANGGNSPTSSTLATCATNTSSSNISTGGVGDEFLQTFLSANILTTQQLEFVFLLTSTMIRSFIDLLPPEGENLVMQRVIQTLAVFTSTRGKRTKDGLIAEVSLLVLQCMEERETLLWLRELSDVYISRASGGIPPKVANVLPNTVVPDCGGNAGSIQQQQHTYLSFNPSQRAASISSLPPSVSGSVDTSTTTSGLVGRRHQPSTHFSNPKGDGTGAMETVSAERMSTALL